MIEKLLVAPVNEKSPPYKLVTVLVGAVPETLIVLGINPMETMTSVVTPEKLPCCLKVLETEDCKPLISLMCEFTLAAEKLDLRRPNTAITTIAVIARKAKASSKVAPVSLASLFI